MSNKNPTPKQVRECIRKILYHEWHLSRAYSHAHTMGVMEYSDYKEQSPCFSLYEAENRSYKTTKDQMAKAFKKEIREKIKLRW